MKTVFLFLGLFCSGFLVAQQTGVAITADGSAAASSAMLDVKSTDKGVLVPRMTTAQRTAIANVVKGLLVFDNTTSSFWFYNGSAWTELASGGASPWAANGTSISNTNSGFVGIGTTSPTEKLHISNGQLRLSRTALFENSVLFNMPASSGGTVENQGLKFSIAGIEKGFAGFSSSPFFGDYFRISTNGIGGSQLAITQAGNVGIGTGQPTERLHVAGNALLNATNPTLQLQNEGVDKGFVQLSGDDLRLGTNSANSMGKLVMRLNGTDHVFVENNGRVGMGQNDPQARLHLNSGASIEALRLTGNTNTIMRFMTGGTEKANIYASGNHLSLNVVQPGGQVRLGNEVYIDNDLSRVGIGTTLPEQKLHVAGSAKITGGKVLNTDNENLLPIGYANFSGEGNKLSGTSNITGGWVANVFSLQCTNADISNATIVITCRNARLIPSWTPLNDFVTIRFYNNDGDELRPTSFSVVVYKTN